MVMKEAIVWVNNRQVSIVTTREELIKEINHYQAFWLSSIGNEYSSKITKSKIIVNGLTEEDRKWLSARMR